MPRITKVSDVENLSSMLDDISIDELSEYLRKLKEFEKTVDSLVNQKDILVKKIDQTNNDIQKVEKIIDEKIEKMNDYSVTLHKITSDSESLLGKKTDSLLNSLEKNYNDKIETFKQHLEQVTNIAKELEKKFDRKSEEIMRTISEVKDKTDDKISCLERTEKEKFSSIHEIISNLNSSLKKESSTLKDATQDIKNCVNTEKKIRESKISLIWTVSICIWGLAAILFIIIFLNINN